MATVKLTEKYVAAATATDGKRAEIRDAQELGLILRVTPEGAKTWALRYRLLDGTQRRLKLGNYPDMSLADARDAARENRKAARRGEDPSAERKRAKVEARAQTIRTLADLADVYFSACEIGEYRPKGRVKRASTLTGERWLWGKHIKDDLGDMRLEEVTREIIKAQLRRIVKKAPVQSNRARSLLRQIFNFAISEDRLTANPVAGVQALAAEKPRARVLTDDELRRVWRALQDPSELRRPAEGEAEGERVYVGRAVRIALELAMLTLQRRTEIAAMRRDELALEQGVWTIQGDRTKNDAAHLVPLPERALALVREAVELSDDADNPSPFVFPSPRSRLKPISGGALTHALGDIYAALGIEGATVHDLRRTGATAMASERLGVLPFVVSRVLNHKSDTGGGAAVTAQVYNVHQYAAEKRTALTAWEGLLLEIVGERRKQVNVTQLRA